MFWSVILLTLLPWVHKLMNLPQICLQNHSQFIGPKCAQYQYLLYCSHLYFQTHLYALARHQGDQNKLKSSFFEWILQKLLHLRGHFTLILEIFFPPQKMFIWTSFDQRSKPGMIFCPDVNNNHLFIMQRRNQLTVWRPRAERQEQSQPPHCRLFYVEVGRPARTTLMQGSLRSTRSKGVRRGREVNIIH